MTVPRKASAIMISTSISKQTLLRLPLYLNYLKHLPDEADEYISATKIAGALNLNHVVVRKDLASISNAGRPKVGYSVGSLIGELENYLGYNDNDAIIIGAGKLGKALLTFDGTLRIMVSISLLPSTLTKKLLQRKFPVSSYYQ